MIEFIHSSDGNHKVKDTNGYEGNFNEFVNYVRDNGYVRDVIGWGFPAKAYSEAIKMKGVLEKIFDEKEK